MVQIPSPSYCACCEPAIGLAPAMIENRPGLSQIQWRTGTYATFRQTMIEMLASGTANPLDPDDSRWPADIRSTLQALTTREDDDYAIMLIGLFSAISDILAFYSERYVNEMFLRTSQERDSLLRLVRMIGYQLAPGTAATTSLAFTLDAGATVKLPVGLKVMSVPGQDESPQTFETLAALEADARFNDLAVFGAPQTVNPFAQNSKRFPILLRPDQMVRGDTVAIIGGSQLELNAVQQIDGMPDGEYFELARPVTIPGNGSTGFKVRRQLKFFGHDVPASYSFYNADPEVAPANRWTERIAGTDYPVDQPANMSRYALDRQIDELKDGALLLVDCGVGAPTRYAFGLVSSIETNIVTLGPMTDTVTRVGIQPVQPLVGANGFTMLAGTGFPAIPDVRRTRVYELEEQAIVPRRYIYPQTISGQTLYIRRDHLDDGASLEKRRKILVSQGNTRHFAEISAIAELPAIGDDVEHLEIGFTPALGTPLAAARMNANILPSSHGEIQPDETLGHGESLKPFQRFELQRGPVTRLPSASGIEPETELAVRVNDELWQEVPSLFGRGPVERVYTVRDGDDGVTSVMFGDGKSGARLPSGAGNVVARYRTGLGSDGRLQADQLTTLLARPVGLHGVTNPLRTDGGADPETLTVARAAAPTTVRTFGRAIALQDFEDVACQTGLVARARASWAWVGLERAIQLTVAGVEGSRLSVEAMATLQSALKSVRDPNHLLILGNLWRVPVVLTVNLLRDPAFEADIVETNARAALLEFFDFETQPLARAIHLSQVIAALQTATGVVAVDIDRFRIKGSGSWAAAQLTRRGATANALQPHIRIFDSRPLLPSSQLDPLALAALALDPNALAMSAEQAFIASPADDIVINMVETL